MTKHKDTIEEFVAKRPQNRAIPLKDRFWKHVEIGGLDQCWNWTGACSSKGYGSVGGAVGTTLIAHRAAYMLTFGEIPPGLKLCHHCDNRKCCNPFHVFEGTDLDNKLDCVKKNRQGRGWHRKSTIGHIKPRMFSKLPGSLRKSVL